jgi:hypothetical protein
MVSLFFVIGQCHLSDEEQVDLALAVHNPFYMSHNNETK